MRLPLLLALCFAAVTAHAGVKESCALKRQKAEAYQSCIETERRRAANQLRDLQPVVKTAISAQIKQTNDKSLLKQYRAEQAAYVRKRKAVCGNKPAGIPRDICEGDMDNAQIQALQKYLK